jgi:hypothetical protein
VHPCKLQSASNNVATALQRLTSLPKQARKPENFVHTKQTQQGMVGKLKNMDPRQGVRYKAQPSTKEMSNKVHQEMSNTKSTKKCP